ncbi:MAG TPA: class I SAM-dependent methyltransferase, partial [Geobacteraceae bacterium]|nr:class I SAM-dependent methyltransferase [Geobacteraceae bacterium]
MPMNCKVCAGALKLQFAEVRDSLTGENFSIWKCTSCGLGHTAPQPDDLARYYTVRYYGNRHGFTDRLCSGRRMRFVDAATGGMTGRRLLDIGCGDGSFLLKARRAGWEVMGTELNPAMARNAGLDVREDLSQVPEEGLIDCITMWHTLEHMRDTVTILGRVAELLRPGGKLIVAVPDYGGLQARLFGPRWLHLDVPRHLYHFDAGALRHSLSVAGFSLERQKHQELEYDLLGFSQSALNYLLPCPNVFFDALTGKRSDCSRLVTAAGFLLGTLLTVLALPPLVVGTLTGRGVTLI